MLSTNPGTDYTATLSFDLTNWGKLDVHSLSASIAVRGKLLLILVSKLSSG